MQGATGGSKSERGMLIVGLMSGTSADGIDAVLVEVRVAEGSDPLTAAPVVRQLAAHAEPWGELTRPLLQRAIAGTTPTPIVASLRHDLSEGFAECTRALLSAAGVEADQVAAIGCHGQTVWHRPPAHETPGTSLQLLDPAVVAAETGIPVVSDFRSADLAAGGQGAPLVAFSDPILFGQEGRTRALLNWGGIANVTRVATPGSELPPLAFDLGPANALVDAAVALASGGSESFDEGGERAADGRVDEDLLRDLLADPWFDRKPPKSTGKESFGEPFVKAIAEERGLHRASPPAGWDDLIATLTEFTVRTTAYGIERFLGEVDEVLVGGGGARNRTMMEGLARALAPIPVRALEPAHSASGVDASTREAAGFALLAWAFLMGRPANVPAATGAAGPRILGSFTPAPGRTFSPPIDRS